MRRPSWFGLALGALFLLPSCASDIAFYEKGNLADPVMDLSEDPLETHFYAKVYYSMEGSIGGIGTSGGGGCGCY